MNILSSYMNLGGPLLILYRVRGQYQLSYNTEHLCGKMAKHCSLILSKVVWKAFDD